MVGLKLPLLLLHTVLGSAHRWSNWQSDVTCESDAYIAPESEDATAAFLKQQYPKGSLIKVVGNGHGFGNLTTCVDTSRTEKPSYIVSLTNLKHIHIDRESMTATVGAGWDVSDLMDELKANGLSFNHLGAMRVQNIVGAVSTGTHGTGSLLGNMGSQVTALRVLDSQGNLRVINETNAEDLKAFRINLGALGLITELTIKVQPTLLLKKTTKVLNATTNYSEVFDDISQLYKEHDRLTVWGPHFDWDSAAQDWAIEPTYFASWWEPTNYTGARNCTLNYCANGCGDCKKDYICYDEVSDATSCPKPGLCTSDFYAEIEHFFPIEHLSDVANNYTLFQQSQTPRMKAPYNKQMVFQYRILKGDDSYLSPVNTYNLAPGHSGVFGVLEIDWIQEYNNFTTLWQNQALAEEFLPRFGETYNVRSHWNKMSAPNATYIQEHFPKLPEFLAIQEHQDPKCQFVNDFLVDQLGISRCDHFT